MEDIQQVLADHNGRTMCVMMKDGDYLEREWFCYILVQKCV